MLDSQKMNFTERMVLRDYAFLERLQRREAHVTNWNFATLATTVWQFILAFTLLNALCVALRDVLPENLNPLTASASFTTVILVSLIAVIGIRVDHVTRRFKHARPAIVDWFSSARERKKWWLTTLSIVPMCVLNGAILSTFFTTNG
jgi:hypothetical protein